MPQLIKDFVYNVNSLLYWRDQFIEKGEWTANKNMTNHLCRIRELLPQALELVRNEDAYDGAC